jgi:penicillin G amidase
MKRRRAASAPVMPRKRRWPRVVGGLLVLVLLVAAGAAGYGWWQLSGSLPRLDGHRRVAGLDARVSIARDALGTVTVEGAKRRDVAFALGFVHAQERYFQMDLQRRAAAGELSELVGAGALELDLNVRRHRLRSVAQVALAQLPENERSVLDAYRDGVNAGLAALRTPPFEYLLLRQKPTAWRSEDSLLSTAAMYLDLNANGENGRELALAQLRATFPRSVVGFLTAPDGRWESPLQGVAAPPPYIPESHELDLRQADADAAPVAPAGVPTEAAKPGSNSFAVSGKLTATGAAIVAGDMHLGLRTPNIWFRARLRYPDASAPGGIRDLNGVTLPGTPALVAGSNGQVAWAFTNSYGDWADWVRVSTELVTHHDEVIHVHGGADRHLDVAQTRFGPILARDTDGAPLALSWVGQLPRAYNMALMKLEQAADVDAALAVAPLVGIPPQNVLFGDSQGHVAWSIVGNSIPLRSDYNALLPSDWSAPGAGWTGFLAPVDYPRITGRDRLWTANNRVVAGRDLAVLGDGGHDVGARAQQIADDLDARASFAPGDMLSIQLDDRAVFLTRWQQLLQATLKRSNDDGLSQLRELTERWSARADIGNVDYRLVRAFRDNVRAAVLAPFVERVARRFPGFAWPRDIQTEGAVWAMVQQQPANLLDPRYADWSDLLRAAAQKVVTDLGSQPGGLAARTWGEANTAAIVHPLSRALPPYVARFIDMPREPLPGDRDMPRVQAPAFGASERFGIMPGHEGSSYLQMPGDQSDHPLSPFHGSGHEDWVKGVATPLLPGKPRYVLTLEP